MIINNAFIQRDELILHGLENYWVQKEFSRYLIYNHPARSLIHSVLENSNLLLGRDKGIKNITLGTEGSY